jgi:hypothetical protein
VTAHRPFDGQPSQGRRAHDLGLRQIAIKNRRHLIFKMTAGEARWSGSPGALRGASGQCLTRLGQLDRISPLRMAEMLEVDKAGQKVRC